MPWASSASRSISPNRMPPPFLRPCSDIRWSDKTELRRIESTYLDRLTSDLIDRTSRADLKLIEHHVAQPLIVDHAEVNVRMELLPRYPGVHWLVAVIVVTGRLKLLPKVVDSPVFLGESIRELSATASPSNRRTYVNGVASCGMP